MAIKKNKKNKDYVLDNEEKKESKYDIERNCQIDKNLFIAPLKNHQCFFSKSISFGKLPKDVFDKCFICGERGTWRVGFDIRPKGKCNYEFIFEKSVCDRHKHEIEDYGCINNIAKIPFMIAPCMLLGSEKQCPFFDIEGNFEISIAEFEEERDKSQICENEKELNFKDYTGSELCEICGLPANKFAESTKFPEKSMIYLCNNHLGNECSHKKVVTPIAPCSVFNQKNDCCYCRLK